MQQVELADGHQQDACSKIDRFVDQVVQLSKFNLHGPVTGLWRVGATPLYFDFSGEFDMVSDVRINKGNQSLLSE